VLEKVSDCGGYRAVDAIDAIGCAVFAAVLADLSSHDDNLIVAVLLGDQSRSADGNAFHRA